MEKVHKWINSGEFDGKNELLHNYHIVDNTLENVIRVYM